MSICWLIRRFVDWLVGRLAGWSVEWMVIWLVGPSYFPKKAGNEPKINVCELNCESGIIKFIAKKD